MHCSSCGNEISALAKFCPCCGKPVAVPAVCPDCGAKVSAGQVFCEMCGRLLNDYSANAPTGGSQTAPGNSVMPGQAAPLPLATPSEASGKQPRTSTLIRTVNMVSMYDGEPIASLSAAVGKLSVYGDRLEYSLLVKTSMFGIVGILSATVRAKNSFPGVLYYENIARVREGKYGLATTLVVEMKNGNKYSFAPGFPGTSFVQDLLEIIRPRL